MNQPKQASSKRPWLVVAQYDHDVYERGETISRHGTYELARAAARRSGYDTFRAIREATETEEK